MILPRKVISRTSLAIIAFLFTHASLAANSAPISCQEIFSKNTLQEIAKIGRGTRQISQETYGSSPTVEYKNVRLDGSGGFKIGELVFSDQQGMSQFAGMPGVSIGSTTTKVENITLSAASLNNSNLQGYFCG